MCEKERERKRVRETQPCCLVSAKEERERGREREGERDRGGETQPCCLVCE